MWNRFNHCHSVRLTAWTGGVISLESNMKEKGKCITVREQGPHCQSERERERERERVAEKRSLCYFFCCSLIIQENACTGTHLQFKLAR